MPRVVYFMRRPRPANYSIEFLFEAVSKNLSPEFQAVVRRSRFFSNGFFRRLYNIAEAALRSGDINHVTGDVHFLTYLLPRQRTVLTIHDCGLLHAPPSLKLRVYKWLWFSLPLSRCALATVVSEASKRDLLKQVAVPENRVHVVPDFVSDDFQYTPRPFDSERPVVLQVGTKPNKNLPRVVRALQPLSCELRVIGPLSAQDRKLLERSGIAYRNLVGLSRAELIEQYEASDILCFVSTLEGFGMPILEAQRVGRPVITSNTSSMPEVAGDGALLVNPLDVSAIRRAVQRLITDPQLREKLVQAGSQNAQRYSLEATVQGYERIYHALLR